LHTAACTPALRQHLNWELFDQPHHSPDLAQSDYHLFTYLNTWLGSQRFNNNEEFLDGVKTWLSSQAADFFDAAVQKLIPRYKKHFNSGSEYVEKIAQVYTYFLYIIIFSSLIILLTAHWKAQ
jgi:hypothetical protein